MNGYAHTAGSGDGSRFAVLAAGCYGPVLTAHAAGLTESHPAQRRRRT